MAQIERIIPIDGRIARVRHPILFNSSESVLRIATDVLSRNSAEDVAEVSANVGPLSLVSPTASPAVGGIFNERICAVRIGIQATSAGSPGQVNFTVTETLDDNQIVVTDTFSVYVDGLIQSQLWYLPSSIRDGVSYYSPVALTPQINDSVGNVVQAARTFTVNWTPNANFTVTLTPVTPFNGMVPEFLDRVFGIQIGGA